MPKHSIEKITKDVQNLLIEMDDMDFCLALDKLKPKVCILNKDYFRKPTLEQNMLRIPWK